LLDPFDDYPVHQTPEPLAHTVSGDRNHYDRYFFNAYSAGGELFIAAALGLYPNRQVADAAFSVVRDGVQTSVHASRRAPRERTDLSVGPVSVRIDEPLRRLSVKVADNEAGLRAELVFIARTVACEEPRFTHRNSANRVVMDYTRLTQFGRWEGWVSVGGERIVVGAGGLELVGSRDRSWGVRSVGERDTEPPGPLPQFFWLWSPVNFDDVCTHFDVQEDATGRRWHDNGVILPVIGDADPVLAPVSGSQGPAGGGGPGGPGGDVVIAAGGAAGVVMAAVDWQVDWRPGTRRAERATISMQEFGGAHHSIELVPILDFQMLGIGYFHPSWGHGVWKGEEAVGVESWRLADLDPVAPSHLHVQQLCRATMGDRIGTGVLEQLVIGAHAPSGLTELFDPAPARR